MLTQVQKKSNIGPDDCLYGYYEYMPDGMENATDLPIVIYLHGVGEGGNGTTDLPTVLRNGIPGMIKAGKTFPFICIMPQAPKDTNGQAWFTGVNVTGYSTPGVKTDSWVFDRSVLQHVKKKYGPKIDESRIYYAGLSGGGKIAIAAQELATKEIAASIVMCPAGGGGHEDTLTNTAVWLFCNEKDPYGFAAVTNSIYTNAQKVAQDKSKIKMTIYAGKTSHDCWTETCNNPDVINWLMAQRLGGAVVSDPVVTPSPAPTTTDITTQVQTKLKELTDLISGATITKTA